MSSASRDAQLRDQHYLCAGCGRHVEKAYARLYRYCEYTGRETLNADLIDRNRCFQINTTVAVATRINARFSLRISSPNGISPVNIMFPTLLLIIWIVSEMIHSSISTISIEYSSRRAENSDWSTIFAGHSTFCNNIFYIVVWLKSTGSARIVSSSICRGLFLPQWSTLVEEITVLFLYHSLCLFHSRFIQSKVCSISVSIQCSAREFRPNQVIYWRCSIPSWTVYVTMFSSVLSVLVKDISVKSVEIVTILFFHSISKTPVFAKVRRRRKRLDDQEKGLFLVCQSCFHLTCHENQQFSCPKCPRHKIRR